MHSKELIESFEDFAKSKNIDRPTMVKVLEEVFLTMIRKKYGTDENFDVIINADSGDLEMWRTREIVDDNSEDIWDLDKIPLSEAKLIEPDFEVGEEVAEEVKLEEFGRRVVQTARQTLIQKVKDLEKEILVKQYTDMIGEMVSGEVYQILSREIIIVDGDGNELTMPKSEQIYKDRFRKGQTVRGVIERIDPNNGNPKIIVSRTSPLFLERLFEQEIPEILDGIISIKNVVREPGERAKVSVESFDDRIDPVGACVGMKGSRIHTVVRELENENIDVIQFTENIGLMIQRALSPAKVTRVMPPDYVNKRVSVFLNQDQVSMAIGKGGQNIKLAGRLVDLEIDVFKEKEGEEEDEEDIDLAEFDDEIDEWVLSEFRKIGLDTAKQVIGQTVAELARRTELEEETIEEVMKVLKREFE